MVCLAWSLYPDKYAAYENVAPLHACPPPPQSLAHCLEKLMSNTHVHAYRSTRAHKDTHLVLEPRPIGFATLVSKQNYVYSIKKSPGKQ